MLTVIDAEMDSEVFGDIKNTMFHRLALGHGELSCSRSVCVGPQVSSHNLKKETCAQANCHSKLTPRRYVVVRFCIVTLR